MTPVQSAGVVRRRRVQCDLQVPAVAIQRTSTSTNETLSQPALRIGRSLYLDFFRPQDLNTCTCRLC